MTQPSTYVIIGATGGIGSVLTRQLAAQGAQLIIGARDAEKLTALADETHATPHPLDATDIDTIEGIVKTATDEYGQL
ncbi:MAG: SDR family NAD(P)-dependent oxidoreductase, partial [Anaerolineales bacterium]